MKVASPKLIQRHLREFRALEFGPAQGGKPRVDREAGVIYGVKVLGRKSPNRHGVEGAEGTDYTLEALRAAQPLYEGICVNVDHPDRKNPGKDRSARDRFAWIQETRVTDQGIFGNLHFLDPNDPLAIKMMNAAERKPSAFALSHNAMGRGEVRNGRYTIIEIPEVRSVDIVADGGTNRSLFEGRAITTTLKKLIEASEATNKPTLLKLLEEMGDMGDMPMDDPMAGGDMGAEEPDVNDHLVNAIAALVKKDDPESHKLAAKILAMLKPADAEAPPEIAATEEAEEDGEEEDDKDDDRKESMESLRRENDLLKREKGVRMLCESEDFRPSPTQLKALLALDNDGERKTLIQESKARRTSAGPRSQGPGKGTARTTETPKDAETFAKRLLVSRN